MGIKLPRGARATLINAQYHRISIKITWSHDFPRVSLNWQLRNWQTQAPSSSKVAAAHHHRALLLGLVLLIVCVQLLPPIWRERGKCGAASGKETSAGTGTERCLHAQRNHANPACFWVSWWAACRFSGNNEKNNGLIFRRIIGIRIIGRKKE